MCTTGVWKLQVDLKKLAGLKNEWREPVDVDGCPIVTVTIVTRRTCVLVIDDAEGRASHAFESPSFVLNIALTDNHRTRN